MSVRARIAVLAIAASLGPCAEAVECAPVDAGIRCIVCRVDVRREDLRLAQADADGRRYGSFEALRRALARQDGKLVFAMNAGMFHPDFKPVGLLVIDGMQRAPINRGTAHGNFYLQPNGVFLVDDGGARVLATHEYRNLSPRLATQSGPMLVHRGQIPASAAFRPNSTSRHLRNGVCAPRPEVAAFVISERPVTLHEFASFFRSGLGCSEALFLDGSISSLFALALGRADARARLGPMFAVVEKSSASSGAERKTHE